MLKLQILLLNLSLLFQVFTPLTVSNAAPTAHLMPGQILEQQPTSQEQSSTADFTKIKYHVVQFQENGVTPYAEIKKDHKQMMSNAGLTVPGVYNIGELYKKLRGGAMEVLQKNGVGWKTEGCGCRDKRKIFTEGCGCRDKRIIDNFEGTVECPSNGVGGNGNGDGDNGNGNGNPSRNLSPMRKMFNEKKHIKKINKIISNNKEYSLHQQKLMEKEYNKKSTNNNLRRLDDSLVDTHEKCEAVRADLKQTANYRQMFIAATPFGSDILNNFFTHMVGSSGMKLAFENRLPENQVSLFIDAETRYDTTNNRCSEDIYVKLPKVNQETDPEPSFQKLKSVDGVAWSCLKTLLPYDPVTKDIRQGAVKVGTYVEERRGQLEWLLLDIIPSLRYASGASPLLGETVQVVVEDSNGNDVTKQLELSYDNYSRFKLSLLSRDHMKQSQLKCHYKNFFIVEDAALPNQDTFTKCTRTDIVRLENDPYTLAMMNLNNNAFVGFYIEDDYNLKTGMKGDMYDQIPQNFDGNYKEDSGITPCTVKTVGLVDANGAKIWDTAVLPSKFPNVQCDATKMSAIKSQIDNEVHLMEEGLISINARKLSSLMSDDWSGCSSLIEGSFNEAFQNRTISYKGCTKPNPMNSLCRGNRGSEYEFCNLNPTHAYCQDPCCSRRAAETKCCAASEKTTEVMIPQINAEKFGSEVCKNGGNMTSEAITAAEEYLNSMYDAEKCITVDETLSEEQEETETTAKCCHSEVIGYRSGQGNMVSSKPCDSGADCTSGVCVEDESGETVTVDPTYASCYSSAETLNKKGFCQLADSSSMGHLLAQCIDNRFLSKGMETASVLFKRTVGGYDSANNTIVGNQLVTKMSSPNCLGPDGHLFDPKNMCQNFDAQTNTCGVQNCNGASDCETQCTAANKCNWDSWGSTLTSAQCLATGADSIHGSTSTHFCGLSRHGNQLEEISEQAMCMISHLEIKNPRQIGNNGGGVQSQSGSVLYSDSLTDSDCAGFVTGAVKKFERFGHNGTHTVPYYTCAIPGSTSKSTCLDDCTGSTNGWKPSVLYTCMKPLSTLSSKNHDCDFGTESNGFKWKKVADPAYKGKKGFEENMPTICVPDSVITETSYTSPTVTGAPTGVNWPWDYKKFTTDDNRCTLTELGGATKITIDDGTKQCSRSMCYKKGGTGLTSQSDCSALAAAGENTQWDAAANDGNGICIIEKSSLNIRSPYSKTEYDSWKSWCTGKTGFTFYSGKEYKDAVRNTKADCEDVGYCNTIGPRFGGGVNETICNTIQSCKGAKGCAGCARDRYASLSSGSNNTVEDGVCVKGVTSESDCTSGWTYIPQTSGGTGNGICYTSDKEYRRDKCNDDWTECEDLNLNSCSDGSSSSTYDQWKELATTVLGCKATGRSRCNTKDKCDGSGYCMGLHGIDNYVCLETNANQGGGGGGGQGGAGNQPEENPCQYYSHVCVRPGGTEEQRRSRNRCGLTDAMMDSSTNPYYNSNRNMDDRVKFLGNNQCAWYHEDYDTQSKCEAANGVWTSTTLTETSCLSYKECHGGSGGYTRNRDETECLKCDGTFNPFTSWHAYEWGSGEVVMNDPRIQWTERKMITKRTWTNTIDLRDLEMVMVPIKDALAKNNELSTIMCIWGKGASYLETVAQICQLNSDSTSTSSSTDTTSASPDDNSNTVTVDSFPTDFIIQPVDEAICETYDYNGTQSCGPEGAATFAVDGSALNFTDSTGGAMSRALLASRLTLRNQNKKLLNLKNSLSFKSKSNKRFTNRKLSLKNRLLGGHADMSTAITISKMAYVVKPTMASNRRALTNSNSNVHFNLKNRAHWQGPQQRQRALSSATVNDASCYSVVKNGDDYLVGQLIGDCVQLTAGGGVSIDQNGPGVELCVPMKSNIIQSSDYTQYMLATKTTTTDGVDTYLASTTNQATLKGTSVCANIKTTNTLYCAAKVTSTYATATSDTGSFTCPAMTDILTTVAAAAISAGGNVVVDIGGAEATLDESSNAAISGGENRVAKATAKLPLKVKAGATGASLMEDADFTTVVKKSIATAIGSTGITKDDVTILSIDVTSSTSERRLRVLKEGQSKHQQRQLNTETEDATVTIDYEIALPDTFTASDVQSIANKISAGTGASTIFLAAFKSTMETEIANTPSLNSYMQFTGDITAEGNATVNVGSTASSTSSSSSDGKERIGRISSSVTGIMVTLGLFINMGSLVAFMRI